MKGYNKHECSDFDETYATVAGLETIRMLIYYSCIMNFKLFQIDVNSTFLNGYIQEEVFIDQPLVFINLTFPNHVFKLKRALYGLKQAHKAWYYHLRKFLLKNKY